MKKDIYSCTFTQLEDYFEGMAENPAKAALVFDWLYRQKCLCFADMEDLKASVRTALARDFTLRRLPILQQQENEQVCKYLFELEDGHSIEAVLMKHGYGHALCVSTQLGCNMGCIFCESGRLKKLRNLSAGEMVGQLLAAQAERGENIPNLVLMGIGEPFDNYEQVCSFIDIVTDVHGLDMGPRHITVSTCGLVPGIERFQFRSRPNNLAVSLHAANDALRSQLMPINRAYNLQDLMDSMQKYASTTRQKITIEYLLLRGINDDLDDADALARLLRQLNCTINLIPYNETSHSKLRRSTPQQTRRFFERLKRYGLYVTLRKELGAEIHAACGQLRAQQMADTQKEEGL